MQNKIIEKIQKLLALSQSPNAEEAASAAAMAAKLMAQYELEEADIRVATGGVNEDPIDDSLLEDLFGKNIIKWKDFLLVGLVKAFHCHGYFTTNKATGNVAYRIIGRKSNVQTVNYMFKYLVNEVTNMANKAWLEYSAFHTTPVHGKTWKTSFLIGTSLTIQKRLFEMVANEANQQNSSNERALAIVQKDRQEVDDFYAKIRAGLCLKNIKTKTTVMNQAYNQGKEAGKGVNLGGNQNKLGATPLMLTSG